MARETKVGLIVGLGVILFVSLFVSDYLSVPESTETLSDVPSPNFVEQTTNQTEFTLIREEETSPAATRPTDPREFAAVSLESIEEIHGTPEHDATPPFREAAQPLTGRIEDSTPLALRPHITTGQPIGGGRIDDPQLALDNQLDVRRPGPGLGPANTVHIDIPKPVLRDPQTITIKHTVMAGETLTAIARKHYDGDGNLWRSIRDANPGKVGSDGQIVQGVVLMIPKRSPQTQDPAGDLAQPETGQSDNPERQRVRIVTVKEGQTLSELAAEHLGSAGKWQLIMDVNTDKLDNPRQLRAGMKLRIPAKPVVELIEQSNEALSGATDGGPPAISGAIKTDQDNTYTVQAGDNLSTIAGKLLGDPNRYDDIYQANQDQLSNADDIRVGMKLIIPAR